MSPDMDKPTDPAFPAPYGGGYRGLTLRDYFAGQALVGLMTSFGKDSLIGDADLAVAAYDMADAMLKERA